MTLFAPSQPCGIFASPTDPACSDGLYRPIAFFRAAYLASGVAPAQTTTGEVVLSFVDIGTFPLMWQPKLTAALGRFLPGMVVRDGGTLYSMGYVSLIEADRCYIDGSQLEIVNAIHFGTISTELEMGYIGR